MSTVLVVDDQAGVRSMLEMALRRGGYEVILAESGPRALDLLRGRSVDLLITDLNMPGMSGFELISAIRRDNPGLRVVLMTGSDYLEAMDVGERLNGIGVLLRKPFRLNELRSAIDRSCAG